MSYSNHNIHSASTGKLSTPQPNSPNFVLRTPNAQKWHLDKKKKASVYDTTSLFKNNKFLNGDNSFYGLRDSNKQNTEINSLVNNTFTPTTKNCIQNTNQFIQSTPPLLKNRSSKSDDSDTEKLNCNRLSDSLLLLHQTTYQKTLNDSYNTEKSKPH